MIPNELGLDPDLMRIAFRARLRPRDRKHYSLACQREGLFRHVDRENPNLLPLLHAYLLEQGTPTIDPVAAIKGEFRREGVSEAGWRYLCRHGARIFRPLWELTPHAPPFRTANLYLLRLDQTGLPPPPPAALLRAWARRVDLYDLLYTENSWERPLRDIIAIGLKEADRRRSPAEFCRYADEFLDVVDWAEVTAVNLDKNQRRCGWPWLQARHRASQQAPGQMESAIQNKWVSLLATFNLSHYQIVPLTSEADLCAEARAMRHCLAAGSYAAQSNRARFFSIRDQLRGRPVADVEIAFNWGIGVWALCQIKGFANRPVSEELRSIGQAIAERYTQAQRQAPLPFVVPPSRSDQQVQSTDQYDNLDEVDAALKELSDWWEDVQINWGATRSWSVDSGEPKSGSPPSPIASE